MEDGEEALQVAVPSSIFDPPSSTHFHFSHSNVPSRFISFRKSADQSVIS
jgi:hypothetical protein